MNRWRWVAAGAAAVLVVGFGGQYVVDRLRSDPAPIVFDSGNGPGYFPVRETLSEDFRAAEHNPVFDGSAVVSDISGTYQWEPRAIGGGGWVKGLEVHPTGAVVIARTDVGGAFRFDRDTQRWSQLMTGATIDLPDEGDYAVESIGFSVADEDRVYLAVGRSREAPVTTRGRVLTSRDGGRTFTSSAERFEIHGQSDDRDGGERIGVSPTDADDVWLGTSDGLWRSRDGAESFDRMVTAPTGSSSREAARGIEWVLVRADVVYIGVAGAGVYASTDEGSSWRELWAVSERPFDAETDGAGVLWASSTDEDMLRRYDPATGDVSVVGEVSGQGVRGLAVHPDGDLVVLLTGGRHIWRTTDGGNQWDFIPVQFGCSTIPWLDSFDFTLRTASSPEFDPAEPNRMWMPEGFAVWSTPDIRAGEVRFECRTSGIEELVVNDIVVPEPDVIVAASWDRPLFRLPPGGQSQAQVGPTDRISSAWDVATTPADPDFLVAIVGDMRFCCEADGQAYLSVFSEDGGRNWQPFPSYGSGDHPDELRFGSIAINSADPSNLVWLPSWDGAVHYSEDAGANWTRVLLPGTEDLLNASGRYTGGSHFQYYLQREVLLADPFVGDRFYLFHSDFGLYRSDDAGRSWDLVSDEGLPTGWTAGYFNAQLSALPDRAGHLLYTPGTLVEGFFPLYESVDGGETWRIVPNTSNVSVVGYGASVGQSSDPTIYLVGEIAGSFGIHRSTDLMASWELIGATAGGYYRGINAITGDPWIPGRVYVGFRGTSILQGTSS